MITSETSARILDVATGSKKVNRADFETAFLKLAKNPTRFHNQVMRQVRRLSTEGLLSRKNRGVYSITAAGRKALSRYDSR
jgi:hypothetical protein